MQEFNVGDEVTYVDNNGVTQHGTIAGESILPRLWPVRLRDESRTVLVNAGEVQSQQATVHWDIIGDETKETVYFERHEGDKLIGRVERDGDRVLVMKSVDDADWYVINGLDEL